MTSCVVIWNNYLDNCHKVKENEEGTFFKNHFDLLKDGYRKTIGSLHLL